MIKGVEGQVTDFLGVPRCEGGLENPDCPGHKANTTFLSSWPSSHAAESQKFRHGGESQSWKPLEDFRERENLTGLKPHRGGNRSSQNQMDFLGWLSLSSGYPRKGAAHIPWILHFSSSFSHGNPSLGAATAPEL